MHLWTSNILYRPVYMHYDFFQVSQLTKPVSMPEPARYAEI